MKGILHKTSAFLSNGLVYGLNGIYLIMPLFLSKYFDSVQSGYLLAIQPLLLCIAPLFWGGITDRAKNQNMILVVLMVASTLAICAMRINTSLYFIALMLVLYAFFQAPYGSLIDVLTINTAVKYRMNYGLFRTAGSVVFGAMAYCITLIPQTEQFVFVYAAVALLAVITVMLMPKTGMPSTKKENGKLGELLKNKELWVLITVLVTAFFTWGYYSNFFPTYITEKLGLDKSIWGIVAFLSAFSELPFFFLYSKIFKKVSIRTIIVISCLAMITRWIVFATVTNTAVLIAVSFVTGLFITVLTYCVTVYIVSAIKPQFVNRAQSLMYAIGTGVPKVLAGCVGGYMTAYLSEPASFTICALISGTGLLLALICKNTMMSIDEKLRPYRS